METWKNQLMDRIDNVQNFYESKEINSFETVKEYFKTVFTNFLNEAEESKSGLTEKKHELYLYFSDLSMALINQEDSITVWKLTSSESRIMAIIAFENGHCFVKYVNPVKIVYLCEDEIEEIFKLVFLQTSKSH